jgi:predicted TIM-barrel fold metal-dependent hydrolase
MIWGSPPEDRPYDARLYDDFWQAASSLQLPVSLHVITGRGRETALLGMGHPGAWYISTIHEVQRSLSTLIFGGVLERYPELRIVSAENDTGWFPHFNYMWASDFPHSDSTFPDSRRWIEKSFAAVPEDVQRKVVFANAVDLYRMQLD